MSASVFPVPLSGIQEGLIAAKGDLIVGTANDNAGILTAGTTGQTLVVDSSTATGLKWQAQPTFIGASVKRNSTVQTIPNTTHTIVLFDAENYDTDNIHSTSTNTGRLTVPTGLGGKWLVSFAFLAVTTAVWQCRILKNGTTNVGYWRKRVETAYQLSGEYSVPLDLAAGDYIELQVYQDSGGNADLYIYGNEYGHFAMTRLGA